MSEYVRPCDLSIDDTVVLDRIRRVLRADVAVNSGPSGWTVRAVLRDIARQVGCSYVTVHRWYYGMPNGNVRKGGGIKWHLPNARLLARLSVYYGVPVHVWFMPERLLHKAQRIWTDD